MSFCSHVTLWRQREGEKVWGWGECDTAFMRRMSSFSAFECYAGSFRPWLIPFEQEYLRDDEAL
jgi:hypothetical protein